MNTKKDFRSGVALVYVAVLMVVLIGLTSLAVDLGHAQLTKTEIQRAADAAARYAATGLIDSTAPAKAIQAASENTCDGQPVIVQNSDVQVGTWNSATGVFTATGSSPTAVKVTVRRTGANGNAVLTPFAMVLGRQSIDMSATSVATITLGTNTQISVPGAANPWLAGMPNGTTANFTNQGWTDSAPTNSPTKATGITITPGAALNFTFTGSVSYYPGTQPFNPDGNPSWMIDNYYATANGGSEHGIANVIAPLTSVIGVFLDDTQPDSSAAPASLDFTSSSSRDFGSISPLLKQPFFIGDGLRADGITPQNFIPPTGATRLYLGVMDGQQWSDNSGSLSTTVTKPTSISTVQ